MLRITIEIFPHGNKEERKTLGTINIANIGKNNNNKNNYIYEIDEPETIEGYSFNLKGKIENVNRFQPLTFLLKKIFNNENYKLNKKEEKILEEIKGI